MPDAVAIITARGGSKRIPRKNIRHFCGKPMITWPIEAAWASECFSHVLVSTDDAEIAEVARTAGAEVPFLRPASLADDFTHAHKAARHMLEWALHEFGPCRSFAHIYPTAPMLTPDDIRVGKALIERGKKLAYTAVKLSFPVYQIVIEDEKRNVIPLFPSEKSSLRSQDMPQGYIDAGQLYWFDTQAFLQHELAITEGVALIPMPPQRGGDIDTLDDWQRAEKMMRLWQQGE